MDCVLLGHIVGVRYNERSVEVSVGECRRFYGVGGGVAGNGEDVMLVWRCVFKPYFKTYVSRNFRVGHLVNVKGEVLPYALDGDGRSVAGYTLLGQSLNLACYPRDLSRDRRLLSHGDGGGGSSSVVMPSPDDVSFDVDVDF